MAERVTKSQRIQEAREKAAAGRAARERKRKQKRAIIQSSVILGVLAVVAIAALVIVTGINNGKAAAVNALGPQNMASGGITLTSSTNVVATKASKTPVATKDDATKVQVKIYEDYQCPFCKQFTDTNASTIKSLLDQGKISFEIHPIVFINNYSLRAASAAGCVANSDPEHYLAFNDILYTKQPDEKLGTGLKNSQLVSLAKQAGVSDQSVLDCIGKGDTYADWFIAQTDYAAKKGAQGTDVKSVKSTPTIIIDNKQVTLNPQDPAAFQSAISNAAKAKGISVKF